ncbi:hypothetical protein SK128_001247 [Halocaridina rubra]|uniref:PIK-related kinase FAT domain-containing protein n=1 Tax=Halocaridina rubra TaxID=373956 RepID=A0AAN9FUF5_HALRR
MLGEDDRMACSKAKLLLARYSEDSAISEANVIKQFYRDACEMYKQWEDGHFHLAMYYDRLLSSMEKKEKPWEWINHIVQSFGKSMQYGCRHVYQSMPRMLALWLEFGTRVSELASKDDSTKQTKSKKTSYEVLREKLLNLNGIIGMFTVICLKMIYCTLVDCD